MYEAQFKSLGRGHSRSQFRLRTFLVALSPARASESVKKNSQRSLPSKCLICASVPMVPGVNDSRPLQFPLQCTNIVSRLVRKYLKIWRAPGDSNSRPPALKADALYN